MGIPFVTERRLLPVHTTNDGCWSEPLDVTALYLYKRQLYVGYSNGYGWGDQSAAERIQHSKERMWWDPRPLILGTVLEICNGYIHYERAMDEGTYAQIVRVDMALPARELRNRERRKDYSSCDVRPELEDMLAIRQSWTLRDQWCIWFRGCGEDQLVEWVNPRRLMRQIRNAQSLDDMRYGKFAEEVRLHTHRTARCYHNLMPTTCSLCK